jgi:hypothetical protein
MEGERVPAVHAAQVPETSAVENALHVTDLQAAAVQGAQSAVNLRFNVAGENLSVRVALQAGQVHTQFRTDSGELRTALAHEWQSVGLASGTSRFADPVFASQSRLDPKQQSDLGGGGGQQPNHQRNSSDADIRGLDLPVAHEQPVAAISPDPDLTAARPPASARLQSFA